MVPQDNPKFNKMRGWLREDFPEQAETMLRLSADGTDRQPLLFDQVMVALDFFSPASERLAPEVVEALQAGYVYLVSGIFCADALVDGHSRGKQNSDVTFQELSLSAVSFFVGASARLATAAVAGGLQGPAALRLLQEYVGANMSALQDEQHFQANPFVPAVFEEHSNIVGRTNIFILLFEFCSLLTRQEFPEYLKTALDNFLFYFQLGDDVGDWREDFEAGRYTSFLRQAFCDLGHLPTLNELEEHVYLSGAYEFRLSLIATGLTKVLGTLAAHEKTSSQLYRYIETQRSLSLEELHDFAQCKASVLRESR